MALLYPFLTTDEGIQTNVLGKDILFKFILPPILKEICLLNNTSIIKEIDKERIDRRKKKKKTFVIFKERNNILNNC